jgi:hypothetical protein
MDRVAALAMTGFSSASDGRRAGAPISGVLHARKAGVERAVRGPSTAIVRQSSSRLATNALRERSTAISRTIIREIACHSAARRLYLQRFATGSRSLRRHPVAPEYLLFRDGAWLRFDGGGGTRPWARFRPIGRLLCVSAKAFRIGFAAEIGSAHRSAKARRPMEVARPRRCQGAPRMATRFSPPSFRVSMPGLPQSVRHTASANAGTGMSGAPDHSPSVRLRPKARRERVFSASPPSPNFGATRRDLARSPRASEAARSRLMRVTHVQQDDYRRVPS